MFRARNGPQDPTNVPRPTAIYESAESPPFYLYWSPDGRQIAFLTQEAAGLSLRVAPVDGSAPATIIRQGAPLYWDWLEPGRALVNANAGGPDAFLGAIGVDGAAGDPTATAGIFRSPAVSRDGRHRAYVALTGPGSEAIVIESDEAGRHEIPVTGMTAFAFDPAGRSLAYIDPAADTAAVGFPIGPIHVIDLETGDERRLVDGHFVAFFWSPDGSTIAGLRLPEPTDEDVAALAARPVRPPVALAAVSGYSLRLAFLDVATAEIRSTSGVRVSQLFGLQILPFFDQYALSHHFWAPDGSSIALPLVARTTRSGSSSSPRTARSRAGRRGRDGVLEPLSIRLAPLAPRRMACGADLGFLSSSPTTVWHRRAGGTSVDWLQFGVQWLHVWRESPGSAR